MVKWNWDELVDGSGVAHESVMNTDNNNSAILKQGYSYQAPPLMNGLVGWWPLHDETAQDYSGNQNHGTVNGATTGVAGRGGLQAMSFDGSNGTYIHIPDESDEIASSEGSFSAYVLSGDMAIDYGDHSELQNQWRIVVSKSQNKITLYIKSGGNWVLQSDMDITLNPPFHFCVTYDTQNYFTYFIDGEAYSLSANSGYSESSGQWTDSINLGSNPTALNIQSINAETSYENYYQGHVFDFRFYNRSLTQSEIQKLTDWYSIDAALPQEDGVSYYPFSSSGATDQWGSNNGTVNGATVTSDAIRGQAYSFDGTDDYISVPNNSINSSGGDASISVWFKANDVSSQQIIYEQGGSANGYNIYIDSGSVYVGAWSESNNYSGDYLSTPIDSNNWYHITLTFSENDKFSAYINAENYDISSISSNMSNNDNGNSIGGLTTSTQLHTGDISSSNSLNFDGIIDDVRIYDRALSPSEIHELFQWGTLGRDMRDILVRA